MQECYHCGRECEHVHSYGGHNFCSIDCVDGFQCCDYDDSDFMDYGPADSDPCDYDYPPW